MVITEKTGRASAKQSLVNAEQERFFSLMRNKQLALPSLHQNSDLQQEATSPTATQSKTEKKKR